MVPMNGVVQYSHKSVVTPDTIAGDNEAIWTLFFSTTDRVHLKIRSTGGNVLRLFNDINNGGAGVNSAGFMTTGDWYHIVTTVSGTTWKVYANGIERISTTDNNLVDLDDGFKVYLGRNFGTGTQRFDGRMDEFLIFNVSMSAEEVYQLYASNLQKLNQTQWYLYVNQSLNSTDVLPESDYTYYAYAKDNSGNQNITDTRTITIADDAVKPLINFISPTLDNATMIFNTSIVFNISIEEINLDEVKWNWNGTNHTFFNDSLVLMYNFDNLSSLGENHTRIMDLSYGNQNNGTAVNGLIINSSGRHSGGGYFDGSDDYVDSEDIASIDGATKLTGMAWVKIEDLTDDGTILAKDVFNVNSQLLFWRDEAGTSGRTDTFTILVSTGTADQRVEGASGKANDNEWHHVAFTYEGGSSTGLRLYIDGIEDANSGTSTTSVTALESTSNSLQIGKPITTANKEFTGYIDEVRIFNRTLSAQEIYYEYASNLNRYNQTQWYLYVNQSLNATDVLTDGNYTYYAYAKDDSDNQNITDIRTVFIDSIIPKWESNKTNLTIGTVLGNSVFFNITLNDSNPYQYVFSFFNGTEWINDTPISYNNGQEVQVIKNITINSGDINWTWYFNDSAGNINQTDIFGILMNSIDNDGDGIADINDPLLYNETNVTISGITKLNITVAGNKTNGQFSGLQEIIFYDQDTLLINFTHNFSSTNLDLSNVTITLGDNSLIVNFSGQLQENKTLYITDDNFVSLCVKDEEIASINEISSGCTGGNETDFTSCLGTSVRINAINCTDEGTRIKIENLQYSAIRGTQASSSSTTSGGGGGSSGSSPAPAGEAQAAKISECTENSHCNDDYVCYLEQCVKLFDIKLIDITSPLGQDGFLEFTYFIKGMANFNSDVIIDFWLENNDNKVSSGQDTIFLGEFDE